MNLEFLTWYINLYINVGSEFKKEKKKINSFQRFKELIQNSTKLS